MPQILMLPEREFLAKMFQQPTGQPNKSWFSLSQGEDDTAELYIYDFIGLYGVEPMAVIQALKEIKGKRLTVRLNTPGGSTFDGLAIYHALREHGGVTMIVDGVAASAGSLILMAGEKIVMNAGSRIMIHDAWALTAGNAEDHEERAKLLNAISADMAVIYSDRTKNAARTVRNWMKEETWFSVKEALDNGFADEAGGTATATAAKSEHVVPVGMFKESSIFVTAAPSGNIQQAENTKEELSQAAVDLIKSEIAERFEIETSQGRAAPIVTGQNNEFCLETARRRLRVANA